MRTLALRAAVAAAVIAVPVLGAFLALVVDTFRRYRFRLRRPFGQRLA